MRAPAHAFAPNDTRVACLLAHWASLPRPIEDTAVHDKAEDLAPGWQAIDSALLPIYGGQQPLHFGAAPHQRLGGQQALDGISVYARQTPQPHWHLVSYGMSELYAKESDDPGFSGWGFEFSMRVARTPEATEPPFWALNFLNNLARYVINSGNVFDVGHYMDLNGPIALDQSTEIRAIVFAHDPELAPRPTVHGQLAFLQVVGITLDELAAIKAWNGPAALAVFARFLPLLITDLSRSSLLAESSQVAMDLAAGSASEGSACGVIHIERAAFAVDGEELTLIFGANGVRDLPLLLPGRIGFGKDLLVRAAQAQILFMPAETPGWKRLDDQRLEVHVPLALVPDLAAVLRPVAGSRVIAGWPRLKIVIEKSVIRDQAGNVVREVG